MNTARRKLITSQLKTKNNPTTKIHYFDVLHVLIHLVIFISGHGIRASLKMPICFLIFTADMK